jgi:hypothetical protein
VDDICPHNTPIRLKARYPRRPDASPNSYSSVALPLPFIPMEISEYEERRNVPLLEMTSELWKRLQESGFSNLAIDARILNKNVSAEIVYSGIVCTLQKTKDKGSSKRGPPPTSLRPSECSKVAVQVTLVQESIPRHSSASSKTKVSVSM